MAAPASPEAGAPAGAAQADNAPSPNVAAAARKKDRLVNCMFMDISWKVILSPSCATNKTPV